MDEDLSIFNVEYDTIIQQQNELKFPSIQKHLRSLSTKQKAVNRLRSPIKLEVAESIYSQSFPTGRSVKKQPRLNTSNDGFAFTTFNNASFGFTPKLKRLIKAGVIKNPPPAPTNPDIKPITIP